MEWKLILHSAGPRPAALFGIISACWGGISASSANVHRYLGFVWSVVLPNGNRIAGSYVGG